MEETARLLYSSGWWHPQILNPSLSRQAMSLTFFGAGLACLLAGRHQGSYLSLIVSKREVAVWYLLAVVYLVLGLDVQVHLHGLIHAFGFTMVRVKGWNIQLLRIILLALSSMGGIAILAWIAHHRGTLSRLSRLALVATAIPWLLFMLQVYHLNHLVVLRFIGGIAGLYLTYGVCAVTAILAALRRMRTYRYQKLNTG